MRDKSIKDVDPKSMKRLAILGLSLILISNMQLPSNAAVKSGYSCVKLGQTSISSGKKFICIKSGKKLIWDKGILISKVPVVPTTFANLEERYEGIPYAVWGNIQANLDLYKSTELKISLLFGPKTPKRYPDEWTINAVTLGSRVMGAQKQPNEIKFIQYNKEDVSWARNQVNQYESPFNLGVNFADQASEKCSGIDCDGAVTNITTGIGLALVGVSNPVNRFNIQKFNGQNDLHEYTHAVQGMIFKDKSRIPPAMNMPCWFAEGQPQAISIPTLAKNGEDYVKIRKGWVTDNRWVLKDFEPETIKIFLKENMQAPCPSSSSSMLFSLGYIVMDALVAIGGTDKTFDVLKARADGLSFEDSFKKVYGVNWDEASIVLSRTASRVYKEYKK